MFETASWLAVEESELRAFDEVLRQDAPALLERYEALFAHDRKAFAEVFDQAARCGDAKTLEILGGILNRHDAHDADTALAVAQVLLVQERYVEAADGFDHPLLAPLGTARVVYGRARALAGSGRFEAALAAVDHALTARPGHPLSELLRKQLLSILSLRVRANQMRGWREFRALLVGLLNLGVRDEAAALLRRLMGDPSGAELSIAGRLAVAEIALRICGPQDVRAFLPEIPAKYPERLEAIEVACDVLSGRAAPRRPAGAAQTTDKGFRIWRALASEAAGDVEAAALQLSVLATEFKHDREVRGALARCVGAGVLKSARPAFAPGRTGRLINLVIFNNEFTLLRMHLEEMAPFVDWFVIVEAAQTFTGLPKPLHFAANHEHFADFADRIVHLPIPGFPDHIASPWAREFYQRDMAIAAASGLCAAEDYILETDTDEIVDGAALEGFSGDLAALQLRTSRYFLNYRPQRGSADFVRPAASIFKAKHLARHGVSYARFVLARRYARANVIPEAGWHFTSVADADGIALKVNSYAHQEQTKAQFKSSSHFRQILDRIRGGELEPGWERTEVDESLPSYVGRNRDALAHLIL